MSVLEAPRRRRFTCDDVYRMVEAGVLFEDEPVELLEGELVVMSPQTPRHVRFTEKIARRLEQCYGPGFYARRHAPLAVDGESLPEPDVALCRGTADGFDDHHPTGADTLLVVEVSLSTLALDRRKAALYARAGVPVYWLLDLAAGRLEVRSEPDHEGNYRLTRLLTKGDLVNLPERAEQLAVAELLP